MTLNGRRVSICIPAKDEEATIEEVITRSKPHGDELFVVDGHSSDRTRELAEAMGVAVYLDEGLGKGCAVREIIQEQDRDDKAQAPDLRMTQHAIGKLRNHNESSINAAPSGSAQQQQVNWYPEQTHFLAYHIDHKPNIPL